MHKPTLARLIAAPFLFVVVLLGAAWTSGFQEIICEQTKSGEEQCAPYNLAAYYLVQIRRTVDENDGLITALATIVIAGFTAALWRSTDNLWLAGEKQMKLIQDNAALQSQIGELQTRAYVSVHSVTANIKPSTNGEALNIRASVVLVNSGQTPAQLIGLFVDVKIGDGGGGGSASPQYLEIGPGVQFPQEVSVGLPLDNFPIGSDGQRNCWLGVDIRFRYLDYLGDEWRKGFEYRCHVRLPTALQEVEHTLTQHRPLLDDEEWNLPEPISRSIVRANYFKPYKSRDQKA
jgi:hypothetical protein